VTEYTFEEFRNDLAAIKQKTKVEKEVIARLNAFADADAMRAHFLPPYIQSFVAGKTGGWQASMSSELNYLPLVIRFFADENMEVVIDEATGEAQAKFIQHISPQPHFKARYAQLTTTTLAYIWSQYLHTHPETDVENRNECKCT
jgi:hypothetical protein